MKVQLFQKTFENFIYFVSRCMDFWHTPIPDVSTSTIANLSLPQSVRECVPVDYWNHLIAYLPGVYKTKLCYALSCGIRTKIVLIYQLLEDPEVDINYKSVSETSIPEELIKHDMNLHLLIDQLRKRRDTSTEIMNKCNALRPGTYISENSRLPAINGMRNARLTNTAPVFPSRNSIELVNIFKDRVGTFLEKNRSFIVETYPKRRPRIYPRNYLVG